MSIPHSVTLRPATADDEGFLRQLFASTREAELEYLPEPQREMLIAMQFNLQRQQYSAGYPQAEHNIILLDEHSAGRLLVDEGDREFTLVDIALLPAYRNLGIGTIISTLAIGKITDRYSFEPVLIGASLLPVIATVLVFVLIRPARHDKTVI